MCQCRLGNLGRSLSLDVDELGCCWKGGAGKAARQRRDDDSDSNTPPCMKPVKSKKGCLLGFETLTVDGCWKRNLGVMAAEPRVMRGKKQGGGRGEVRMG